MFNDSEIDRAAQAGFNAYTTGKRMPSWVIGDGLLESAWNCGRRQAADNAISK
jgi:hypothetical protein